MAFNESRPPETGTPNARQLLDKARTELEGIQSSEAWLDQTRKIELEGDIARLEAEIAKEGEA